MKMMATMMIMMMMMMVTMSSHRHSAGADHPGGSGDGIVMQVGVT